MTAQELLTQLRAKGVELKTTGDDRLVIDAPKGTITEDLRAALSANKAGLLQILKSEHSQDALAETPPPPQPVEPPKPAPTPVAAAPAPPPVTGQDQAIADSTAEEIAQLEIELGRLRTEEEGRRAEFETERLSAENALRVEQERWRKDEEEVARRRAEQERQRIEAEARERAEEEKRRQIADQEVARAEQEVQRIRTMEQTRRQDFDKQVAAAITAHEGELAKLREVEEQQARRRAEQERHYLEAQARKRAQEDELRRRAETRFRAVEEEIERVSAREQARVKAALEAQRLADEAERRRADEEARRLAEEQARRRAEEEAKLRAEIEAQLRAEAAERRRIEEETRRQAEEEARRRAEEEAKAMAAERARRLAEEEARRRVEEEARRQAEAEAQVRREEEARRLAAEQERMAAARAEQERADSEVRERAEMEARIRAEVAAKIRAEEAEQRRTDEATRRRAEHERIVAEEESKSATQPYNFEIERSEAVEPPDKGNGPATVSVNEIVEWFDMGGDDRREAVPAEPISPVRMQADQFIAAHDNGEFREVTVPTPSEDIIPAALAGDLASSNPSERAAAVSELTDLGGEDAFRRICSSFDDPAIDVRSSAARALFNLHGDRAAAFTRALRDATPERRRKIGAAIASSGLANEAIRNLTGESRDKTYDAFSLLFLMAKAGELQPLMRAIEEHPSVDVRLAVVKLLALSGQPDILPSFRRMAVRGSLPPDVRSAVMEAIYQISSQSPMDAQPMS